MVTAQDRNPILVGYLLAVNHQIKNYAYMLYTKSSSVEGGRVKGINLHHDDRLCAHRLEREREEGDCMSCTASEELFYHQRISKRALNKS